VYEAVVLKTLGATRKALLAAYVIEYFTLGAATALLSVAAGSLAAAFVLGRFMHLPFVWLPGPLLACCLCSVIGTVSLGLIGTFKALGQKAGPVLRNL
jgi:putative ABC transport system permease protein